MISFAEGVVGIESVIRWMLVFVGVGQVVLGIAHIGLPRVLQWKTDLAATSPMTQAVSYVHTFFIGLVTALFGLIDVFYRVDLLDDPSLGRLLAGSIAIFWGCRAAAQVFCFAEETRKLPYGWALQILAVAAWPTLTCVHLGALMLNIG
jgi:hypothetical protein